MPSIISKFAQNLIGLYQKAEDLVDDLEFAISEATLNSMIQKYVTANVSAIHAMWLELHDGWLRLYATIEYKGSVVTLNTDLIIVQFKFDHFHQKMVFEQKSDTRVINHQFKNKRHEWMFNVAIWICRHVLHIDPLSVILEKLDVAKSEFDLIHLDINRFIYDKPKIMKAIQKIQLHHGAVRKNQFVIRANLDLKAVFNLRRHHYDLFDTTPADQHIFSDVKSS